ncbi:MAG: dual-specificity RNA methyltransferase RlmN [Planctomycetota bacterium]|jgi:23S rRNA (adenine2503-C2)-methyltransferase
MAAPACITDFLLKDLEKRFVRAKIEKYRAQQVLRWAHRRRAKTFAAMSDLPKGLRAKLEESFRLRSTKCAERKKSADGTEKIVVELDDGDVVEAVLIREDVETKTGATRHRRTGCISTQVGCPVKCVFCASGIGGLKRNLTAGEIVEQVHHLHFGLPPRQRLDTLVLMGIGEPLLNYNAVVQALRTLKAAWGGGFGFNRVTLSTVGVVKRLKDLVRDKVTPNLAISLHAPDDKTRHLLVPSLSDTGIDEVVRAGIAYRKATRKDVTFEYVLIGRVNDQPGHARRLGKRLAGTKCKVNVIPYNPVPDLPYEGPTKRALDGFVSTVGACGVPVMVRKRKGDEISAACGQLRATWEVDSG